MTRKSEISAGLLVFRRKPGVEVLLGHPGGPYWARKDAGAWSIPKGEYEAGEDPLACAAREFEEELGTPPPEAEPVELGAVRQAGGKLVTAWAVQGDFDPAGLRSNSFSIEWPPRSGAIREFPEVDRAQWFPLAEAKEKIVPAQAAFVDRLAETLAARRTQR